MLQNGQTAVAEKALGELRAQLRGTAGDPSGVTEGREPFNAMHSGRPALTVACSGTADVIDAVRFAREHGMAVAVRGGGHSIAGLSTIDGGMLIDLAPMRGVQVDPDARLARVEGGALWGDVDRETQAFGLVAPGGVVSDTGVAGLTLGGGYGWVRRRYGLSCYAMVEAQVVCAVGDVRQASADSNPDLFWGLRGGGGNFGIVTSFTFRLEPLGPIVAFAVTFFPVEEAQEVMCDWRAFTENAPDEITSVCVTITFPADPAMPEAVHDRPCIIVGAVYAGDPDEGTAVLQPLRELDTPLADLSQPMPFTAVDAEDTAFSERSARYMVSIDGLWSDPEVDANRVAWVRSTWEDIGRFGTGAVYLNFMGLSDEPASAGVDTAFGRNLRRLAEIKATYDPDNFFRHNNNIAPAT